jgi:hypothetical protein
MLPFLPVAERSQQGKISAHASRTGSVSFQFGRMSSIPHEGTHEFPHCLEPDFALFHPDRRQRVRSPPPPLIDLPTRSDPAHRYTEALTRSLGGAVISRRSARLNFAALTSEADNQSGQSEPRLAGQSILLHLPGSPQPRWLEVHSVYEDVAGVLSYTGQLRNDPLSHFTLTTKDTEVLGKIHVANLLYVIQGDGGIYDITTIDKTLTIQPEDHEQASGTFPAKIATGMMQRAGSKSSGSGNVRLLYLYTPEVVARKGSPDILASNVVSEMNSSLQASGVPSSNFVTLAGMLPLNSNFSGLPKATVITTMRDRSGSFSDIDAQMMSVHADIALTMIAANDNICPGAPCNNGRVGGVAIGLDQQNPFTVVTDSYALGDLTAPHEIGHVFGGAHELASNEPITPGAELDARGYVDSSNTWMTIMGGYTTPGCPFRSLNNQPICLRLPRWSNPLSAYNYMNLPTGVSGQSNMARALGIQMPRVAAYRNSNGPAPGDTGSIALKTKSTVASISWSTASGSGNTYQLEMGSGSAPVMSVIYSGPGTSASHLFKNLTTYTWRVRACNASGCGPYSTRIHRF